MTGADVFERVGSFIATVLRDMCQRGFDRIDSLGWERAIEGIGDAT